MRFSLYPSPDFQRSHSLLDFKIDEKYYSVLHHLFKAHKFYKTYNYDITTTTEVQKRVSFLSKYLEYETKLKVLVQDDAWMQRYLCGYRIEYSMRFSSNIFTQIPNARDCVSHLRTTFDDVMHATNLLEEPVYRRYLPYEEFNNHRQQLLLLANQSTNRWTTVCNPSDSNPQRVTLSFVSNARLATLCSSFGIADHITCKVMRHIKDIHYIWSDEAVIAARNKDNDSLERKRDNALKTQWLFSLTYCNNDRKLYDACEEAYKKFVFRFQSGRMSNAKFMTYWRVDRRRSSTYENPSELLREAVKKFCNSNLEWNDFFCPGQGVLHVKPKILFVPE